jgi:hypothetical protein
MIVGENTALELPRFNHRDPSEIRTGSTGDSWDMEKNRLEREKNSKHPALSYSIRTIPHDQTCHLRQTISPIRNVSRHWTNNFYPETAILIENDEVHIAMKIYSGPLLAGPSRGRRPYNLLRFRTAARGISSVSNSAANPRNIRRIRRWACESPPLIIQPHADCSFLSGILSELRFISYVPLSGIPCGA